MLSVKASLRLLELAFDQTARSEEGVLVTAGEIDPMDIIEAFEDAIGRERVMALRGEYIRRSF